MTSDTLGGGGTRGSRTSAWLCALGVAAISCALIACGGSTTRDAGPGDSGAGDSNRVDAGPTEPADLSVVTWNLKNFFDSSDDPSTFDDVPSASRVTRKVNAVGRVLADLDADVIVLQEVENVGMLNRLADGPLAGKGYDQRVLMDAFDPRGINVGFLSRLPVLRTASHFDEWFPNATDTQDWRFARDAPEIFVDVGGFTVIVMGVHFLSQLAGDAEQRERRLAEALQVRRILDQRVAFGNTLAVLAGDFNDVPRSPPYAALLDNGGLVDITLAVPESGRYTTDFRGVRRQFDYILATPAMAAFVVTSSVRIARGSGVDDASDHDPVFARFHLVP
ncbi:MAG: hypothetical protein GXP55_23410 [Deltaproteobacteria bacterium]|nr:hypothetical protein [Deltaproteobacteria bacterium]